MPAFGNSMLRLRLINRLELLLAYCKHLFIDNKRDKCSYIGFYECCFEDSVTRFFMLLSLEYCAGCFLVLYCKT